MKSIGEAAAIGIGAVLLVLSMIVGIFLFATSITSVIVFLVWNLFGIHTLFHASSLSFWHVVGIAVAINLVRGILGHGSSVKVSK